MSSQRSEIVVVGGGFGGALLSWILAAEGKSVTLIDAPRPIGHPIVGESSTPLADLILLQLANQYSLPSLAALARYGSWASTFGTDGESGGPICGKKRGFSYFAHTPNQYFRDPTPHSRSLYVTASADDASSDTHWHRESVDAFLRASAVRAGARLIAGTLEDLQPADRWRLSIQASGEPIQLRADEIVDATALAVVARLMRRADVVQAPRCKTNQLQTATHSVFTHLRGVGEFANSRSFCVESTDGDPFHGDDAAQHHLLHDGWMWVLRFDNGIASVGRVFQGKKSAARPLPCDNIAKQFGVSQYPSLRDMLSGSTPAYPTTPLVRTKRLQKW
ncbi:MAG: NAD(P)-binding protein, partial [Planctomycetota bacterium]